MIRRRFRFYGYAKRSEYALGSLLFFVLAPVPAFMVSHALLLAALFFVEGSRVVIAAQPDLNSESVYLGTWFDILLLLGIALFLFALLWFWLALVARRLRDTGISLWWMLLLLVPVANLVAIVSLGCLASQEKA